MARNIGHILDHSIRPVPLAASEVESLGHLDFYVSDSLLDPRFLERPVAYQTSYSSSQWGSRLLTAEEIGISFGLPGRLRVGGFHTAMFPFVPVQVLGVCLDSLGDVTGRFASATVYPWTPSLSLGCHPSESVLTILGLTSQRSLPRLRNAMMLVS